MDYHNLSQGILQNQAKLVEIPQSKKQLLKKLQDTHKKLVKYLEQVKDQKESNTDNKKQEIETFQKLLKNDNSLESMIMRNDLNILLNSSLKKQTQASNSKSPNSNNLSNIINSSQQVKEEINQNSADTSQYEYIIDQKLKPLLNKQVSDYFSQKKDSIIYQNITKYQNRIPKIIKSNQRIMNDEDNKEQALNSPIMGIINKNKTLLDKEIISKQKKSKININSLSSNDNEYTTSIIAKPIFQNQDYYQLIKPDYLKHINEQQISILKSKIQTPAIKDNQNKIQYQQFSNQKQIKFEDLLQHSKLSPLPYKYHNNERATEKRNSYEIIKIVNQQQQNDQKKDLEKTFILSGKHINDIQSLKQAEQHGYQKINKRQKIMYESKDEQPLFTDHGCNPKSEQSSPLLMKRYIELNQQISMNNENVDQQNQKMDELNSSLYIPKNIETPLQIGVIRSQSRLNLQNDSSEMNSAIEIKQFSIRESQTFQNGQEIFKQTFYNLNQQNQNAKQNNNQQSSQNLRRTIIDIGSINGNSEHQSKNQIDQENHIQENEKIINTESNHNQMHENSLVSINSLEQQKIIIHNINQLDKNEIKNQRAENWARKSIKRIQKIDKKRNTIPNQDLIDNVLQIQHIKKETIEKTSGSPFKKYPSKDYGPVLKKSIIFQIDNSQENNQENEEKRIIKQYNDADISSTVINSGLDSSRNTLIPSLKLKQLPYIQQININRRQSKTKHSYYDHQQFNLQQSTSQEKLKDQLLLQQIQGIENISNFQQKKIIQSNQKKSILHVVYIQLQNQNNEKQNIIKGSYIKQQKNETYKVNDQKKQRNTYLQNSNQIADYQNNNQRDVINSQKLIEIYNSKDQNAQRQHIINMNDQQNTFEKQKHSITINLTNDDHQISNDNDDLFTNRNIIQTETQTQNQDLFKTIKDKKIGNIILKNFAINQKTKVHQRLQNYQVNDKKINENLNFANKNSTSIERVNSQLINIYKSQNPDLSKKKDFKNNSLENLSFLAEISDLNHTISQPRELNARREIALNQSLRSRMSQKSRFTISDFNKNLTSKDSINKFRRENLYQIQNDFQLMKKISQIAPQKNIRVKRAKENKHNIEIKYENIKNRVFNSSLSNYNNIKPQKDADQWKLQIQETNQKIEQFIQKINFIETYRKNQKDSIDIQNKIQNKKQQQKTQNSIMDSFEKLNDKNSRSKQLITQGQSSLNQKKQKNFTEKIQEAKQDYEQIQQPLINYYQSNKSKVRILKNKEIIMNTQKTDRRMSRQKMNSIKDDSSLKTREYNEFEVIQLQDASLQFNSSREDNDKSQKNNPVSIRSIINQKEKIARNQMLSTFSGIGKRIQIQQVKMNDKITHFSQKQSIKIQSNRNAVNTATSDYEIFKDTEQDFSKEVEKQKFRVQANLQQMGMRTATSQMTGGTTVDDKLVLSNLFNIKS